MGGDAGCPELLKLPVASSEVSKLVSVDRGVVPPALVDRLPRVRAGGQRTGPWLCCGRWDADRESVEAAREVNRDAGPEGFAGVRDGPIGEGWRHTRTWSGNHQTLPPALLGRVRRAAAGGCRWCTLSAVTAGRPNHRHCPCALSAVASGRLGRVCSRD